MHKDLNKIREGNHREDRLMNLVDQMVAVQARFADNLEANTEAISLRKG